jgi:uncharacterized protein
VHVHAISFDGRQNGCFVSEHLHRRPSLRLLKWIYGIRQGERAEAEGKLQALYRREIEAADTSDRFVVLALDAVYDAEGRRDETRTHLYVPNRYVEELAGADGRLWAGASVHPDRPDALDELDRCAEAGAVLIKWLPNTQGIDPASSRHRSFYRKLATLGLPLLTHTGMEYSLAPIAQSLGHPVLLRTPLDEGVTVIAAHGGGADLCHKRFGRVFIDMLRRYPHLYGDTAGLTLPLRSRSFLRLLNDEGVMDRLVHGSDFPLPTVPWSFLGRLSWRDIRRVNRVPSILARDVSTKRALGMSETVFTRASTLLRLPRRFPKRP